MADTTNEYTDEELEITFNPNTDWESKLYAISVSTDNGVNFTTKAINSVQVSSGKITLPIGMSAGNLIIKFHATGYEDATVSQIVIKPKAEVRIKTVDNNIVQVDEARGIIFVNRLSTVGEIKSVIESYNGTSQIYKFVYSNGDDTSEYTENVHIQEYHSAALHVIAEDGLTIGYYTIIVKP